MAVYREFAPAKINLTLEVLGKRPDGYHELKSLVAFADVGDVVTLDTSRPLGVTVSGPFGASIAGANLIDTTLRLIAQTAPDLQLGAVHLEKILPVAAGIGGGSADAAALIRAVKAANPKTEQSIDWTALALKIGADVPVCLTSKLSWMTGLGEHIAPVILDPPLRLPALIVNPLAPVPAGKTAQVFRALAAPALDPSALKQPQALRSITDVMSAVADGGNALEAPARRIVPEIAVVLAALASLQECRLARMSGGGPTCFALFEDEPSAKAAGLRLLGRHPAWWICASALS